MIESDQQRIVDEAITSRHSIRAFLPTPIAREDIEQMLAVASRAPSGSNTQPWKAYVLTCNRLKAISADIVQAFLDPEKASAFKEEYRYAPDIWETPYIDRRR